MTPSPVPLMERLTRLRDHIAALDSDSGDAALLTEAISALTAEPGDEVRERARKWLNTEFVHDWDVQTIRRREQYLASLLQTYGDERERTALEEAQRADDAYEEALMNMRPENSPADTPAPIDVLLFCPRCNTQHVDAPEGDWTNPPHKSHLCHSCGAVWRPSDHPTNGVSEIKTVGKSDTFSYHKTSLPPGSRDVEMAQ